jgi:RNA polymerase-interacting CarD/CdnL/TRCF family regulator
MTAKKNAFSRGDWVVHLTHGIGQVQRMEKKTLGGKKKKYFRVENKNCVFWVPVEQAEQSRVRPVASRYQLRKAIKALKEPPRKDILDSKQRQKWIKETRSNGSLSMISELVRDLSALQDSKSLGENDRRSFDFFKKLLLQEWSICADMTIEDAKDRLKEFLAKDQALVSGSDGSSGSSN